MSLIKKSHYDDKGALAVAQLSFSYLWDSFYK